jgi:hypothetical protein
LGAGAFAGAVAEASASVLAVLSAAGLAAEEAIAALICAGQIGRLVDDVVVQLEAASGVEGNGDARDPGRFWVSRGLA